MGAKQSKKKNDNYAAILEKLPPSQWMRKNKYEKADVLEKRENASRALESSKLKLSEYKERLIIAEAKSRAIDVTAPDQIARLRLLEAKLIQAEAKMR